MGEETTWFDLLPGVKNLDAFAKHYLGRDQLMVQQFPSAFSLTHVFALVLVLLFVTIAALVFRSEVAKGGEKALVPPRKFGLRNLVEMFTDAIMGIAEPTMGAENARRFLPLIGTFAFFIFFSNVLALIPGFAPPTAILKTTAALGLFVFVMTHVYGFIEQGPAYLKHFLGPVWWLAWLLLPIELVSHIARPVSLSIRLCGNMAADHKVVAAFFALIPLLLPVPFLILGVLVAVVQTLVFSLLTMVYIQGAVEHGHGDDEHGHHHYDPQAVDVTA